MLGGENSINGLQGELSPIVKEVGEVGLPEACLAREEGHAEGASLNSSEQFLT